MNKKFYKRLSVIAAVLLLMFFVAASTTPAQEKSDAELKKKYAPILGEYEFDLTSMGDIQILNYYIQEGELWADFGDGESAVMEPMEEEGFAFEAISSDGQTFEIRFSKDEQGGYSTCKILIVDMGLEVEGTKIK
ncbi:MAG: hypothetical protein JW755_00235 [Candidatus Aminicenantes bacterium]|nr:hypothetical protein [Candidatus Aminicenantes bacterium]